MCANNLLVMTCFYAWADGKSFVVDKGEGPYCQNFVLVIDDGKVW